MRQPLRLSSSHTSSSASTCSTKYPDLKPSELTEHGEPDYLKLVLTSRVYDVVDRAGTPLQHAVNLSDRFNTNVYLKREDLLPVFSFKLRGAYNMIAKLHEKAKGNMSVIACSAGNHAQGVAYAAHKLGIPATIVMPTATPAIKYKNVIRLGSLVVLYGDDFDGAKKECARLIESENLTNIPPFDHPYVIAGQGTCALEITRQISLDNLTAVFIPVGGGGLISGVGAYIKSIAPHVKIIGVETFDADALYQSLKARKQLTLDSVGLFADGTAVRILGNENWHMLMDIVDDVVRVNTDELCAAIKDVFEDTRSIMEPSGALLVAGMKRYIEENPDIDHRTKTYVPILSGANMNFDRLRFVSERAVLGEGKEALLVVTMPEVSGEFVNLIKTMHPRFITEFSYRYSGGESANLFISFAVNDKREIASVMESLKKDHNYDAVDISDNELAKSHGRYLVGGKASTDPSDKMQEEKLISFEFPERPAALYKFLLQLKPNWDITLFNYRNNGNDVGKVLCGFALPLDTEQSEFNDFLHNTGYKWVDESHNVIYEKFLKK